MAREQTGSYVPLLSFSPAYVLVALTRSKTRSEEVNTNKGYVVRSTARVHRFTKFANAVAKNLYANIKQYMRTSPRTQPLQIRDGVVGCTLVASFFYRAIMIYPQKYPHQTLTAPPVH